ncbi:MAG: hypothetical protein GWN29_11590, partial [Gammaproteobacteria bacterium]|nr:hypothetical protein [Gammaproteobacteria bacterium]
PPDPADPVRERPEPEPPAFLRDVFVYVTARPDSLTIGDRAVLEVVVEAPAGVEVLFPPGNPLPSRRIDVRNFEVRDPQAKQTQAVEWVGEYEVSIYAVGEVVLPPWPVQVRQGGIEAIARSDSVRFFVGSVLDDSLAAAGIADLKPQEEVPVPPPWRTLFWIAALVVLAVLMYGFWRSRRHEEVVQLPPPRPAHEVALAELRKLETLRLPFDGKIKQHYMALSEILRTY